MSKPGPADGWSGRTGTGDHSLFNVAKVTAASRGPESPSARSRKAWLRVLRTSTGSAPAGSLNIARRLLVILRS